MRLHALVFLCVVVKYRSGTDDEWKIKGSDLAVPEANLYLYEHRE